MIQLNIIKKFIREDFSIFKSFLERLKHQFFPDYSVGYFVVSIPKDLVSDVINVVRYCCLEALTDADLITLYFNLLIQHYQSISFVTSKFYRQSEEKAIYQFEKMYADLVFEEGIDKFLPKHFRQLKQQKVYAKEGEVLLCTAFAAYKVNIKQINSKMDLIRIISNLKFEELIPICAVKFQASNDSETEQIIDELNLIST